MSSGNSENGENDSKATSADVPEENVSNAESTPETLSGEKIQELDTSYRILNEIIKQNKSTCWPFMEKVDVQGLGLWDYEQKVKEPMWINKILEKFDQSKYAGITDFARDFRTMVENCYRYNGTEHAISKKAKRLEMAFEAKLALLKKDFREKTDLNVTSNGRFAVDMNGDSLVPVSRYGRMGNTREYASVLDDSSPKLVYDFVRCEETVLQEDEKKASHRERRQQEILYQQMAAAWINSAIETHPDIDCIKTCHTLPEVALFLQICETTLKFPEMNMYQFERSLLVPDCSIYLSKLMTPLLCSYQERGQINLRPPMQFQTWNSRLKERLIKWFELVQKHQSYTAAAERIGLNVEFFQSLEWKNPFFSEKVETFSDLKYDQKVQILKALCDSLVPLQIVQNALFTMDASQLQCMQLGKDLYGNVYIYFPQFCGDEVRVYRHREFGAPVSIDVPGQIWSPPKPSPPPPDPAENSQPVNGHIETETEEKQDETKPNDTESPDKRTFEKLGEPSQSADIKEAAELSPKSNLNTISGPADVVTCKEECSDSMNESQGMEHSDSVADKTIDSLKQDLDSSQEGLDTLSFASGERRTSRVRKQTTRYQDTTAFNHHKKSARKRPASVQKEGEDVSKSTAPKKPKKPDTPKKVKKEKPVRYGNVDFEMLCDSVDAIQLLINKLQSEETNEKKSFYGHNATENHRELIAKLRWLYDELEPWNVKLQKARLSVQIQMKKEHNQIQNSVNQFDPWTEELSSRVAYAFGENLTISHADSPMSSVESYEDDEDDISHPYYTRLSLAPKTKPEEVEIERVFDESLYEEARVDLLPAALIELEEILKDNVSEVMKVAGRSELQEHNSDDRQRTTRHKVKQQNKLLGKVLTYAENNTEVFPSLLPILIPNSDVFDIVDMVFLQEETRLREIEEENRRKRLERSLRRQKPASVKLSDKSKPKKQPTLNKVAPTTISIRMHNGRVYPATRLSDGRVIPIMRRDNSSPASSVEELLETTRQEIKKSVVNQIPTISLKGTKSPEKKCPPSKVLSPRTNSVEPNATTSGTGTGASSKPTSTSDTVKVKHAPKKIVVTQPLQRVIGSTVQSRPSVTHVIRHSPVRPIILNGQRYGYVSGAPAIAMSSQAGVLSAVTSQTIPVILSQPTPVVQPPKVVLTPVQVVSPVRTSKPGGVMLVPFQNCDKTTVSPVRMVSAAPVLGVITSPQRQLQFQNNPEESEP